MPVNVYAPDSDDATLDPTSTLNVDWFLFAFSVNPDGQVQALSKLLSAATMKITFPSTGVESGVTDVEAANFD
jgi:hypothetical protein